MSDIVYKDGATLVLDLLRDAFGDQFEQYYNGDPEEILEVNLPCIMVSETQGAIDYGATGTDNVTETVRITIALNKKDDLGGSEDTDLTELKLRQLVKAQDPDTGEYIPETIMYALRTHISMGGSVLRSRIETDFDVNIRGETVVTQEAYVTVYIDRLAIVPSRTD